MKRFALVGAAGFVAPRHMQAIKETGNQLIATYDPHDSVGILDSYFPEANFFTDFNLFSVFLNGLSNPVDYYCVATPNDQHFINILHGLITFGANVICEKPLVLHHSMIKKLKLAEKYTKLKINAILQLRFNPAIQEFKNIGGFHDVEVEYHTPRGNWYFSSWKGDPFRSGGLLINIGIHMFDLLLWLFGPAKNIEQIKINDDEASGKMILNHASVKWHLSIKNNNGFGPIRKLRIDEKEINLSGLNNLHIISYKEILAGRGYGIDDVESALRLVNEMQNG